MPLQSTTPESQPKPQPITNELEAQHIIHHLSDVMDALVQLVEEETQLVRTGRLSEALELGQTKSAMARAYIADTARLKASQPFLAKALPNVLDTLRRRHDQFRALLQINLTVLATAHAVSESIMRGVNSEMQRRSLPHGYTAAGHHAAPDPRRSMPLSLSRSL